MRGWILVMATAGVLLPLVAIGQTREDFASAQDELVARPDPDGTPTEISVGLYFLDVAQIDDVAQDFGADVVIRAAWTDPRLADPKAPPTRILSSCRDLEP